MSKAAASISNRKSSSSAAAMRGKDSLTFVLHPKQLVAFRSKATEILFGGANREKRPVLSWSGWRQLSLDVGDSTPIQAGGGAWPSCCGLNVSRWAQVPGQVTRWHSIPNANAQCCSADSRRRELWVAAWEIHGNGMGGSGSRLLTRGPLLVVVMQWLTTRTVAVSYFSGVRERGP